MRLFDSSILYFNNQQDGYSQAECYRQGRFVNQNMPRAIVLYEQAALAGDARAMFRLGEYYQQNNQKERALSVFYKACMHNNQSAIDHLRGLSGNDAQAAFLLGKVYETKRQYAQSIIFYTKSHELRHPDGLYHVGTLFQYLSPSEKKGKEPVDYYIEAVKVGSKHALAELIELSETSGTSAFCVANIMEHDLKQIDRAFAFYEKAARNGHAEASLYLAQRTEEKNDDPRGMKIHYNQGAESGSDECQAATHRLNKELLLSGSSSLFSTNTQLSWNKIAQNMKRT